jgi:RNA polymerase sigma-70 factor (ECF subfamily)
MSDRELLSAIAARDGDAFAAFHRRHLPRVLAFLVGETRDAEVSADLAAEVFSAVLLAAERYEPQSDSAAPWLVGIARNTLGASRRRGRVEHGARLRLGFEPLKVDDADPARTVSLADRGQGGLSDLLASLPRDQRDAVEARVLDERSYSDIASELSCLELVVRKRVSRGLARLRQQAKER